MAQIFKKCKVCKEILTIFSDSKTTICLSCKHEFNTSDLFDENDTFFFKNFASGELETALKYNALIGQGNDFVSSERFDKAEETFKQAISLDENRYEAYFGVARAKTHDFRELPDSKDYLEYAKIALDKASDDIDPKINANLAKLGISKK